MGTCTEAGLAWGFVIPNHKLCDILEQLRKKDPERDPKELLSDYEYEEYEVELTKPKGSTAPPVRLNTAEQAEGSNPAANEDEGDALQGRPQKKSKTLVKRRRLTEEGLGQLCEEINWNICRNYQCLDFQFAPFEEAEGGYDVMKVVLNVLYKGDYGGQVTAASRRNSRIDPNCPSSWKAGYILDVFGRHNGTSQTFALGTLLSQDTVDKIVNHEYCVEDVEHLKQELGIEAAGIELKGQWILSLTVD